MKSTSTFKSGLEKLDSLWKPGQFGKALSLVDRLLGEWQDNVLLLVKKARLIQLQEGDDGPSLDEAKALLERALALDDENPVVLVELGFYLFAVEDNAAAALAVFDKADGLLAGLTKECRQGRREAHAERSENEGVNSVGAPSGAQNDALRTMTFYCIKRNGDAAMTQELACTKSSPIELKR